MALSWISKSQPYLMATGVSVGPSLTVDDLKVRIIL